MLLSYISQIKSEYRNDEVEEELLYMPINLHIGDNDEELRYKLLYENIKRFALYRIGTSCLQALQTLHLTFSFNKELETGVQLELPKRLFGWKMSDLRRRLGQSTLWLSLLRRHYSNSRRELEKMKMDLREVKHYVYVMLESYLNGVRHRRFTEIIPVPIDLDKAEEEIYKHYLINQAIVADKAKMSREVDVQLRKWRTNNLLMEYYDTEIREPILRRYRLAFHAAKVNQKEYALYQKTETFENDIRKYLKNISNDEYISSNILSLYGNEIFILKTRIEGMMRKYETDFDIILAQNQEIRLEMDKLRLKKNFLKENIRRYRDEIREFLMQEEGEYSYERSSYRSISRTSGSLRDSTLAHIESEEEPEQPTNV